MEISRLPTELQESVLFYLDGSSLARSQCVCKLWQSCVGNLAKVGYIWFEKCTQEILPGTLKLLIGGEPHKFDGTWNQWKSVYQRWYRSRFVKTWTMKIAWQQSHWVQDLGSDRVWQLPQLQISGDEVVLLEWTHMARWAMSSGDQLPLRDLVNPNNTKKLVQLVKPITSREADSQGVNASTTTYPCQILSVGDVLFLFTKSRTKSFQLPNEVNCMDIWNKSLIIGWVMTGKLYLYKLPDDLLTCTDLLHTSYDLLPHSDDDYDISISPPFESTGDSTVVIVGNRGFLSSGDLISVLDLEKKLSLASITHDTVYVMHMVTNGKMVFFVARDMKFLLYANTKELQKSGVLKWLEWDEETQQLLRGKTPKSVPRNIVCIALYGDLLALGTSDGLIYTYTLNRNNAQKRHVPVVESSDSDSDVGDSDSDVGDDDFNEGIIPDHEKTETMIHVESALMDPHTFCLPDCDMVEDVAISDDGSGPVVAAVGTKADEKWKRLVFLFKWSND